MNDVPQKQTEPAVRISGLTKRFGFTSALDGVDLTLEEGQFLAIFGPNGAGKTTLLHILSTLIRPTSGTVHVFGYDLLLQGKAVRQLIGVLDHNPFLVPTLTAPENLKFYGQMFGVKSLASKIESLLENVGLSDSQDQLVETFSRGMQQRLAIARALLHAPRLLLLDEPYTGLDQKGISFLKNTLKTFVDKGNSVIMTDHDLVRGLELCSRVIILRKGRLVLNETPSRLGAPFETIYQRYVE